MPRSSLAAAAVLLGTAGGCCAARGGAHPETIRIEAVDEGGRSLGDAEATLREPGDPTRELAWRASNDAGEIRLARPGPAGALELLVRAPGHALVRLPWTGAASDAAAPPARVVLPEGRKLELFLGTEDGREIPEILTPIVFDSALARDAWASLAPGRSRCSIHPVQKYGARRFVASVPPDATELYVLIDEPGFLRAFQAGPITSAMLALGRLEIPLPPPASVHCEIEPRPSPEDPESSWKLEVARVPPGGVRRSFPILRVEFASPGPDPCFTDLAPGTYAFSLSPAAGSPPPEIREAELTSAVEQRLAFQVQGLAAPAAPR